MRTTAGVYYMYSSSSNLTCWDIMISSCFMRCVLMLLIISFGTDGRLLFEDFETFGQRGHLGQLLDNQHIVMIGDSLMRYQYIALAYLIHYRSLPPLDAHPNILQENGHGSWLEFHRDVNKVLKPNEYCDCYRLGGVPDNLTYENRYYHDPVRNISLTFLLYLGERMQMRGHWMPTDTEGNDHFKAPDDQTIPPQWEYDNVDDVLTNIASKLTPKPTTLILNAGHWPHNYKNESHRERVIGTARRYFPRVIWKTTSGHNELWKGSEVDPIMCAMPGVECLDLSWTLYLHSSSFVDYHHFKPSVYNDIAVQMVLQLASGHAVRHNPVPAELRYSVVEVPHNGTMLHYMADQQGLLRRFTMPPTTATIAQVPCIDELNKRPVHKYTPSEAKKCVGGDIIEDICAYLKHEVREGDLMRIDNSKTVYLIEKGVRREFTSFHAFVSRGYDFDNVKVVNIYEGDAFPPGEPLT